MYKLCVFVFLCFFGNILCLEIGSPCNVGNVTGVCKSILECPYAIKLVNDDEKKPPMCFWKETLRIVCCPTQNLLYRTGVFEKYFEGSNEGVLRSENMTCRYDGKQPFLCCHNVPDLAVVPEPRRCPTLPAPKLKAPLHFAWTKCLEYQRYFNVCIEVGEQNYRRFNTCPMSQTRISGGNPASPKEFPHMAVLGCHNTVSTEEADIIWTGGGSLISEKFILTAAHVLVDNRYGLTRYALLGTLNKTDIRSGLLCNVVRTIPYKAYVKGEKKHDIALVELNERVKFNEFIRPACLPVAGREVQVLRIIAGWGEIDDRGKTSDVLLTTTVIEDQSYCEKKFERSAFFPDTMICAKGNVGSFTSDACKGDSGGPLMALFSNLNCSYIIEGVVSYGPRCGKAAGVYTNVSIYLDWIAQIVWPNEWKVYQNK
ncbi:unnamed protein product, partial [Brenthis ino]